MDKNKFRKVLKETANMFFLAEEGHTKEESVACMEMYDQISHEVFPKLSYEKRSDPVFKYTILTLLQWKCAMDRQFPSIHKEFYEEDEIVKSNIIDFNSFKDNHTPRRYVG